MKIWTVLLNNDDGVTVEVFADRFTAVARMESLAHEAWGPDFPPPPQGYEAIFEALYVTLGYVDSYSLQEHEI